MSVRMRKEINKILLEEEQLNDFDSILTIPSGCYYCGCEVANITQEVLEKIYQAGYKEGLQKMSKLHISNGFDGMTEEEIDYIINYFNESSRL